MKYDHYELTGIRIAILGGDDRELVLMSELLSMGAEITVVGFDQCEIPEGAVSSDAPGKAVKDVDAVIMPMPGTDAEGTIRAVFAGERLVFDRDLAKKLVGKPVFIGTAKPFLSDLCRSSGIPLIEIAELDEVAILNSIPSAEGAIQMAMQETPFTLHGSSCFVLGFGRVGITLARMLKGIGAKTFVAARRDPDLARAFEAGFEPVIFEDLLNWLCRADVIFNTVPAPVLGPGELNRVKKEAVIIDLASAPGGTDFTTAERLGIKAVLAPGLPGKVAPLTAGKILASVYPKLILNQIKG